MGRQHDEGDSRVDAADATHLTLDVKAAAAGLLQRPLDDRLQGRWPQAGGLISVHRPQSRWQRTRRGSSHRERKRPEPESSNGPLDVVAYWLAIPGRRCRLRRAQCSLLVVALPAARDVARQPSAEQCPESSALEQRLCCATLWSRSLSGSWRNSYSSSALLAGTRRSAEFLTTSFRRVLARPCASRSAHRRSVLALRWSSGPELAHPDAQPDDVCGTRSARLLFADIPRWRGRQRRILGTGRMTCIRIRPLAFWVGRAHQSGSSCSFVVGKAQPARAVGFASVPHSSARFSPMAAASVTIILLTGIFNGVVEIPTMGRAGPHAPTGALC